jgi:hypothetical protein
MASDQEVLRTTLAQIPDFNAQLVLRASERGRAISREVSRDPSGGAFWVKVTLLAGETKESSPDESRLDTKEPSGKLGPALKHQLARQPHALPPAQASRCEPWTNRR